MFFDPRIPLLEFCTEEIVKILRMHKDVHYRIISSSEESEAT